LWQHYSLVTIATCGAAFPLAQTVRYRPVIDLRTLLIVSAETSIKIRGTDLID
jgi:hypothetical protein